MFETTNQYLINCCVPPIFDPPKTISFGFKPHAMALVHKIIHLVVDLFPSISPAPASIDAKCG